MPDAAQPALGGEEKIEDMLDFALHGWDVVEWCLADPERRVSP